MQSGLHREEEEIIQQSTSVDVAERTQNVTYLWTSYLS